MDISRRKFIGKASLHSAAIAAIPAIVSACVSGEKGDSQAITFSDNDVVLFQGDSITDAGREKRQELPNNSWSFGPGYAFIAGSELLQKFATKKLLIYNRGISGNKVFQLAERWKKDCLDLKPNVLSILIGVNDYWHKRDGNYDGTPEIYENDYRALLQHTKETLPDVKLILCEPFILTGTRAVDDSWIEPFSYYQEIAHKLSEEFDTIWVPYQKVFTEAAKLAPPVFWTEDGVHPTMAGCQLMAAAWLKAIGVE